MLAAEINRLHKVLDDGGIKLGGVVSDINGVSARAMVSALIEGRPIEHILGLARGKLKQKSEELGASLEGDLSTRHLFVLAHLETHIQTLQNQLAEIDNCLLKAMQPYAWAHELLQTKRTLAAKYRSMMLRKSHKKAIIAIAHKMIRLIFLMLNRRQPYIDQGSNYAAMSATKNAPRWIKQLKAIGRWPAPKPAAVGT